jgi:hypothetical protein
MNTSFVLALPALLFGLSACSSSDSSTSSGTSTDDAGTTPALDAAPEVDAASLPKAPTLDMLMRMTGGLHVMWTNNESRCDAIEGERKTATDAYMVVFTLDGALDNQHDGPLTAGTAYTYRLRCKKAGVYSVYSNEKSGTP